MANIETVLVLCTGNSARSIMGEALLQRRGAGRLTAYSAGSAPKSAPNPHALGLLQAEGYDISRFTSKSWNVFTGPDAPSIDLVITVCDAAAGEACPNFRGARLRAHWGIADPAAVTGSAVAIKAAFDQAYAELDARISRFCSLPLGSMSDEALRVELDRIGAMDGATARARAGWR